MIPKLSMHLQNQMKVNIHLFILLTSVVALFNVNDLHILSDINPFLPVNP